MAVIERAELRGMVLDDRYKLGACIGVGGTGVVFEAEKLTSGERVVVKTMRPMYALNRDLGNRLRREGEVARRVPHPGIVPVSDEGSLDDGSPYIVMRHVRGESLSRLLLRGALDGQQTAAVAMRVASILHAVHGRGYVHRDVKPEHILLDRNAAGTLDVTLLDFGVCASDFAPAEERERERGRVYGTPTYVSPEQASGNPDVDGRADVFGLGVVMFECLVGRVPFSARDVTSLLRRIIREDAPRVGLILPEVSRDLDAIIARCMAREPAQRFATMRTLTRALSTQVGDRIETESRLAARLRRVGEDLASVTPTVRDDAAAA